MATPRAPSSLTKVLSVLKAAPAPILPSVRALKLTLAKKNAHFGARHFLKEELPRIAYVNPALEVEVEKKEKAKEEQWDPQMVVHFVDGSTQTINMQMKHSSKILEELMTLGDFMPQPVPSSNSPPSSTSV
ncbi:hypothetical protein BS47DRAFT_1350838 [Hydnum rufescens UP504]|uniref:Ribosomal protein/NADH dehydrogenase domain-containing protein n=1 Tax=Hydnum rufescens UP504 TaxID=1448309 RepID=A0A9P6ALP1_9AGAM|nr:hypothetical protein BS47DRAFT_1350838 [Hydnum rufescens UP504]